MEHRSAEILKSIDSDTIIFLKKDDFFTIHGPVTPVHDYLNVDQRSDKRRETRLNHLQYESAVKYILNTLRLSINEYHHSSDDLYTLELSATPYNWTAYLDIMDIEFTRPVCAIIQRKSFIYLAFFDFQSQVLFYLMFEDDEILSNLYSFFTEINCFDVIIEDIKIEKIILNMGLSANLFKGRRQLYENAEIECLIQKSVITILISYLNVRDAKVMEYKMKRFMKIDNKTLENLDIFEIFKVLKPITKQGKRYLSQVLRQPLLDTVEISKRHEYCEALHNFDISCLNTFPDLLGYSHRILRLKIKDVIDLYKAITRICKITEFLMTVNQSGALNDFIIPLEKIYKSFDQVIAEIEKIIDFEKCEISQNISELVYELNQERKKIHLGVTEEYERVVFISKKIKIENTKNAIIHFKVPRSEHTVLKENNFVEKSVLKGGIIFTTKKLEELNHELENIHRQYSEEERKILDNLLILMNNYTSSFEILNYIISMIDVFYSFSTLKDLGFTRPILGDKISIKNMFHPLVKDCVKNDFLIDEKRFCVITGPNMGGKSTIIKLLGIITFLGQIGCYVPAESAIIPLLEGIYIRIGANDLCCKGMSTFMVEMNDVARICKNATDKTLVIIDELGRGTSAIDGLSLALSIRDFLIKKNSFTLFATHFPEVCTEYVTNKKMACKGDENGLVLLYKMEEGVCDVSLGVEVAKSIGFPKEIIDMAKIFLLEE